MKQRTLWTVLVVAAAAATLIGWRLTGQRGNTASSAAAQVAPTLELGAADVFTVRRDELQVGLPVSGTLKATRTALVKARVAGELMDLTMREGDTVRAGQVLARIDPTEYEARWRQARQQADAARAQMDIAQKQFDNNEALVKQGFISQTALQTSLMSLQGAQASYQSAVAAADVARKALDDTALKAPIAGQIAQRLAQPGERLVVDARVVEIVNLEQFEVEAPLPAQDAGAVQPGMAATLQVEGLAQAVTASVLRINPSTQSGSRSVLVYLGVRGVPGLRQGAFAQGQLGTRTVQALTVPLSSIRTDKPTPYVQLVDADTVRHVPVEPGARSEVDGVVRVAVNGLSEGAQVLTGAVGSVREGVKVRLAASPR
jgi:RND family efflux transporter MFP subunit